MNHGEVSSMKLRAVIFDLFGTLAFIHNKVHPYSELLRALDVSQERRGQLKAEILTTPAWNWRDAGEGAGRIDAEQFLRGVQREVDSSMLYPETAVVLSELRRRGYVLGCISNLAWPYKEVVKRLGLDCKLDFFIFSCDAGLRKPQPEIYALASEQAGIPLGEMLMVGDNPVCDVAGPKASGMQSLQLQRGREKDRQGLKSLSELLGIVP